MVDPELARRARHRQNQRAALALAGALLPIILIEVVGVWHRSASEEIPSGSSRAWWFRLIILTVPVIVAVVPIGLLLLGRRRGVAWLQPTPALGVDREHRRRLLRAIRTGTHLTGRDEELALDIARRTMQVRWAYLGLLIVIPAVVVLLVTGSGIDPLAVLVVLLTAIALPLAWRDVRRARRYLRLPSAADS